MRIKLALFSLLVALTLTATAALADPPKKKPTYPPPEQSNTVGVLGQHHTAPGGPPAPRDAPPPVAAPEVPKVEAEPPAPVAAPERFVVHPDGGGAGSDAQPTTGLGGMPLASAPVGPPPTGFLPDHPFISGIVAGLIGADLGSKLYGGPMMGDQDGVLVGYGLRLAVILGLAWLVYRLIARLASGPSEPGLPHPGRREPSFGRQADAGGGRREPTLGRPER